jgi:hypothetical protein
MSGECAFPLACLDLDLDPALADLNNHDDNYDQVESNVDSSLVYHPESEPLSIREEQSQASSSESHRSSQLPVEPFSDIKTVSTTTTPDDESEETAQETWHDEPESYSVANPVQKKGEVIAGMQDGSLIIFVPTRSPVSKQNQTIEDYFVSSPKDDDHDSLDDILHKTQAPQFIGGAHTHCILHLLTWLTVACLAISLVVALIKMF